MIMTDIVCYCKYIHVPDMGIKLMALFSRESPSFEAVLGRRLNGKVYASTLYPNS